MLYFISILAAGEIASEAQAGKRFMEEQFGCKVALRSPPHITLIPPVELTDQEAGRLMQSLDRFSPGIAPFNIDVEDYEHFNRTVIYLRVIPNDLLTVLHSTLHDWLQQEGFTIPRSNLPFVPHITIATRDIPTGRFAEAYKHFSLRHFVGSMIARRLTLLRKEPVQWEILHEIDLS